MKYDQTLIERIRDTADIVEVIGERLSLMKKGSGYISVCPFHNDTNPSLRVHTEKQIYKCFACGAGGNVYTFLMEYDHKTFPEAVRELAEKYNIPLPQRQFQDLRYRDEWIQIKEINRLAARIYHQYLFHHRHAKPARLYLKGRGLHSQICQTHHIGYAPSGYRFLFDFMRKRFKEEHLRQVGLFYFRSNTAPMDFFHRRVMFPIENEKGEVVGFGGRSIKEGEDPKYLNTAETALFKKNTLLYGLHKVYHHAIKTGVIYVVEGYLDVIACQQNDISAVAPLGTALTTEQVRKLKRYAKQIKLVFDGDRAGRNAAERAAFLLLEAGAAGDVILLPEGSDPFDYLQENRQENFLAMIEEKKISIDDYLIETKIPQDLHSSAEKKNIAEDFLRFIGRLPDQMIRNELKKKAAQRLKVETTALDGAEISIRRPLPPSKDISQARKNKVERRFIEFLCDYPPFIREAASVLTAEEFEDRGARLMFEHLLRLKNKTDVNFQSVLDIFSRNPSIQNHLMKRTFAETPPSRDRGREFQDRVCQLKLKSLRKKKEHLQTKMKEAAFAEEKEMKQLQEQIFQLVQEEQNLKDYLNA